jgi:DNA replication and repair protein RecF
VQVRNLRLVDYRNFRSQEIDFCPGTNLFFGQNGQGKTNLMEAIYLLSYGRSFRTSSPRDSIRHGAPASSVTGKIEHGSMIRDVGVLLSATEEKKLLVHQKVVGLGEFIGKFHALAFTQEHLKVVRGGPAERRAFIDRAMITSFPGHMQRLAGYGRALKQRNHLLATAARSGGRIDGELIESWDEKLIQEGSRIIRNRRDYIEAMTKALGNPLSSSENLEIRYVSRILTEGAEDREIEGIFRMRLREARAGDERRGFTTVGPHRDELKLLLDERTLADFGSAGQQRSCLLALYFAQMEIHRRSCGFYPVFLMDDVEAELDRERLEAFLAHLAPRTQTFLTTAKEQFLPPLGTDARRYRVQAGRVEPGTPAIHRI